MKQKKLSIIVWKENKWFVAKPVGIELASQGKTKKEATANLKEALKLLTEDENISIPSLSQVELTHLYA